MSSEPRPRPTRETFGDLPVLCTDGAWGTELMKLGGEAGETKDIWNLTAPDKVLQVARAYVEAGASIVLTNTFSSNRYALALHALEGRSAEITRAGAEISRRAADDRAYVFGSIGPTGKMVSLGELSTEEAEEAFREQATALEEGGVDAIVIETQTDLEEAGAALRACLSATRLPVGVSFTFEKANRTIMGVTVEQAHQLARAAGASFVGANCGVGIEAYVPVARLFADCGGELPIWIKGNAGIPQRGPDGTTVYTATPEDFAAAVPPLLEAGARFIGGCCGSTPEHIRAIVRALAAAGR